MIWYFWCLGYFFDNLVIVCDWLRLRQHRRPPFVSQALRPATGYALLLSACSRRCGFWGDALEEASKQANVPPDEAAEASKISSRRLQNRGPRASKWSPGGLLGVEEPSFEAKAVFEAILEAILRLLPPPWDLENRPTWL